MEGELTHKALSVTVALFAGYLFFRISYLTRFSLEHLRTDRLALHLFGYAAALIMGGAVIAQIMPDWTPSALNGVQNSIAFLGFSPTSINAIGLAILSAFLHNLYVLVLMWKDQAVTSVRLNYYKSLSVWLVARLRMAAIALYLRRSEDPMLRTLFRATVLRKPIMVTLKNNKVYVGQVMAAIDSDPTKPRTSLKLFPIASGIRHKDTKKVKLSTIYVDFLDQLSQPPTMPARYDISDPLLSIEVLLKVSRKETKRIDSEDLGIVFVWNQVHSLTIFDGDVYRWFENQEAKRPRRRSRKVAKRRRRELRGRSGTEDGQTKDQQSQ